MESKYRQTKTNRTRRAPCLRRPFLQPFVLRSRHERRELEQARARGPGASLVLPTLMANGICYLS
jgi:hypothetical protein